jgi:putative CocE/NonD family hydrolase
MKEKNPQAGVVSSTEPQIYSGDSFNVRIPEKTDVPVAHKVPYGTDLEGVYFEGYPQLVKQEIMEPKYEVEIEKDIMVAMRDGTRLAVDIYRPKDAAPGETFPVIMAWGMWGKDNQESVRWLKGKPQAYFDSPFWDGNLEAGDYTYTVPRGYVHVVPEPRGIGNSEGAGTMGDKGLGFPILQADIYDTIEWIAEQSWCNGNVGMMGPSSYSMSQIEIGQNPPPALKALHPCESITGAGDYFHGIYDTLIYHIFFGRHGNDSAYVPPNYEYSPVPPQTLSLPREVLEPMLEEALNHPDIKYNSKWYAQLKYPMKAPIIFDTLMGHFNPSPGPHNIGVAEDISKITLPMYIGAPWLTRFYLWSTLEAYEQVSTPAENKKLIIYPPLFPSRPYVDYHDEIVRWYDHWLKGEDNGIMDEPPIKMFVMGVNKWRFENEWPLARTQWEKFYLQPKGSLVKGNVKHVADPDCFVQPSPNEDPTVYSLNYKTEPFTEDTEMSGPIALYLDATIDKDDTNWMIDLLDVGPDGERQWLSSGHLKAQSRALDEEKSKPYTPIHPRQAGVPVPVGEKVRYSIALMSTANVFKKGHSLELIIRNQDDILCRLGTWGTYMLPFMQTVTHKIHLGDSHLLLPIIPAKKN